MPAASTPGVASAGGYNTGGFRTGDTNAGGSAGTISTGWFSTGRTNTVNKTSSGQQSAPARSCRTHSNACWRRSHEGLFSLFTTASTCPGSPSWTPTSTAASDPWSSRPHPVPAVNLTGNVAMGAFTTIPQIDILHSPQTSPERRLPHRWGQCAFRGRCHCERNQRLSWGGDKGDPWKCGLQGTNGLGITSIHSDRPTVRPTLPAHSFRRPARAAGHLTISAGRLPPQLGNWPDHVGLRCRQRQRDHHASPVV